RHRCRVGPGGRCVRRSWPGGAPGLLRVGGTSVGGDDANDNLPDRPGSSPAPAPHRLSPAKCDASLVCPEPGSGITSVLSVPGRSPAGPSRPPPRPPGGARFTLTHGG